MFYNRVIYYYTGIFLILLPHLVDSLLWIWKGWCNAVFLKLYLWNLYDPFNIDIYQEKKLGLIWFGRVLCHINHCRLFNAKSSLYIYMKYIWFVDNIFKQAWAHFFGTQLNGCKYCYMSQFYISQSFAHILCR